MEMRKVVPVTVLAIALIIIVLWTIGRRTTVREKSAAVQSREAVRDQHGDMAAVQHDNPKAATSAAHAAAVVADTAAVDTVKQEWVKIPGTGIGLWPKP